MLLTDIIVYTGSRVAGEWENSIAIKGFQLVIESNSFVYEHFMRTCNIEKQNQLYNISNNIRRNMIALSETPATEHFDLEGFYFINSFNFSNSGHDLSIGLDFVAYILRHNITTLYILEGYKATHNFKLWSLLLPDVQWIELKMNSTYTFKRIYIIPPVVYSLFRHLPLIEKLRCILADKVIDRDDLRNRKVLLIKSYRNKNVMNRGTCYDAEDFIPYFEEKGYINVIPEEWDIFELAYMLMNASDIITSEGSIVYTNQIFFNDDAKITYLYVNEHNRYQLSSGIIAKRLNVEVWELMERVGEIEG